MLYNWENKIDNRIITLGRFKTNLNGLCYNLREIYHSNYSFFGLGFIFIYAFEQALLLFFSVRLSPELALGIGLFILIMLTTIAIERLLMESRNKKISDLSSKYVYLNKKYKENIEMLETQNEELIELISKD